MDKEYTLIELINELHKNYEPGEEYEKRIKSEYRNVIKNSGNRDNIYINFMNGPNKTEKKALNIVINNGNIGNINKDLNEKVNNRTTGYYIIISDLDKDKMLLQLGIGHTFFIYSNDKEKLYIKGYQGYSSATKKSLEIRKKIEKMEEFLFENAKGKVQKQVNNNRELENIINSKLCTNLEYTISEKELDIKIDALKKIIANYPEVMKEYINQEKLKSSKIYYEKIYNIINQVKDPENKSGRLFTLFNWMYIDNELDINWSFSKSLKESSLINNLSKINDTKSEKIEEEDLPLEEFNELEEWSGKNIIYYGIPGSGKSYYINHYVLKNIDENHYERIVFYPEYTYTDFVGTYKLKKDDETNEPHITPVPGPFTRILTKAVLNSKQQYVLIIEEMNRGNAEAIFGDIFQMLDRSDDAYKINNYFIIECINAEIDKENNNNTKKIKKLSIDYKIKMPKNLTILATINTSDQNVFNLDTAFGRRWEYLHVTDNFLTENHIALTDEAQKFENDNIKGFNIQWSEFRNAINNAILDSDNIWNKEDKRLGKFYISGDMLCDKDDSSFLEESYENNKIRASFLNKVLRYLWFDVFKSDHSELIDDDNINSFEQLVDKLKKSSDALNTALKPLKNNEENN